MAGYQATGFFSELGFSKIKLRFVRCQMDIEIMFKKVFFLSQVAMFPFVFVLSIQSGTTMAEEAPLSDDFSMVMEPPVASIEIEESEVQDIMDFFHQAERAIESESIDTLMTLYSDKYTNLRNGDKEFAEELWNKIFAGFDNISSRHSMQLIAYDEAAGQAITECSGLLSGTPKGESRPVTIDRWDNQRHILIKDGYWKLFGNVGKAAQRYGEEGGKLHPLF